MFLLSDGEKSVEAVEEDDEYGSSSASRSSSGEEDDEDNDDDDAEEQQVVEEVKPVEEPVKKEGADDAGSHDDEDADKDDRAADPILGQKTKAEREKQKMAQLKAKWAAEGLSQDMSPSEIEHRLQEEIRKDQILEMQIENAEKTISKHEKIQKLRNYYKRRHQKLEKKFRAQIMKNKQKVFLEKFSPSQYHRNMVKLAENKKRKELKWVIDIIEQYDFFFKNLVFAELIQD